MPRAFIAVSIVILTALAMPDYVHAQQSTGSIRGRLDLPNSPSRVSVELTEMTSGIRMLTTATDSASGFYFHDVPYGSYLAHARQGNDTLAGARVVVNSAVPVLFVLSASDSSNQWIGSNQWIDPQSYAAMTHSFFPRAMIERMAAPGEGRRSESILLNSPGLAPGEDGRLHMRGEDAGLLTVIDGFPFAIDLTRRNANLLNANLIRSADILRGGLNAEYGNTTSGVLALTSQTGIGKQFQARGYQTLGTYQLSEQGAVLGGGVSENVGYFAAYNRYSSNRFLDPVSGFDPDHSNGYLSTIFGKLDLVLGRSVDLVVLGTYNDGNYAIPNSLRDSAQNQTTTLFDYMFGARANWHVNDASVVSLLAYTRLNSVNRLSSGLRTIEDSTSRARAIVENEHFFVGSDYEQQAHGGLIEYSMRADWGENRHEIKIGLGGETIPLKQSLTLAVTDSTAANAPFGHPQFQSIDLTRGGSPMIIDKALDAQRFNAFIQDEVQLSDRWSVGLGLRYDRFKLIETESGISPRLQTTYQLADDLSIRGSYNRLFMHSPLENILIGSSQELNAIATQAAPQTSYPRAQKSNVFELGALWMLSDHFDIDLAIYSKMILDMHASTEIGTSGILLPITLAEATVTGGELQLRIKGWNDITGQVAVSASSSIGRVPESGPGTSVSSGPAVGDEHAYYTSAGLGETFPTLNDQNLTASWLFNYDDGGGYFFTFGGRFDSGLPFALLVNDQSADASQTQAVLLQRGVSEQAIELLDLSSSGVVHAVKPRVTLDLGVGLDLRRFIGIPIRLSATALNVLDERYLTRFKPTFGGAHYGQPRSFVLTLEAAY